MFSETPEDKIYDIKISDENEQKPDDDIISNHEELKEVNNDKVSEDIISTTSGDEKYLERLQRLQAEFVNYKKRIEREKLELSDFFKSELIGSLLPVIDDFERMLDHSNNEDNEFLRGIELIYQKLLDILKDQGLQPIESVGQKFDPNLHEAILIETSENGEDETVAEELRKGYIFNNKLLRPAQVKVIKTK